MNKIKLSSQEEFYSNIDKRAELIIFKINDNNINDYIEGKEVFKTDIIDLVKNKHDNCITIDFEIVDKSFKINEEGWYIPIFKIKNENIYYKIDYFIPCYRKNGDIIKFM